LTVTYELNSTYEFIEVFNDQEYGPDSKSVRLIKPAMSKDGPIKRVIKMNAKQPVRIWYHADAGDTPFNSELRPTIQSTLSFQYKWTTGKLFFVELGRR
jgi:hypothetical protein